MQTDTLSIKYDRHGRLRVTQKRRLDDSFDNGRAELWPSMLAAPVFMVTLLPHPAEDAQACPVRCGVGFVWSAAGQPARVVSCLRA